MRLYKPTLWLMAGAVFVAAVAGYVFRERDQLSLPARGVGEAALPAVQGRLDEIDRIVLSGREATSTLVRNADGWTIEEKTNLPAERALVAELLAGLAAAKKFEPRTAEDKFYERLGLQSRLTEVTAFAGGQPLGTLKTGDQFYSPTGEGVLTFALDEATGRAWTYSGLPEISSDPVFWLTKDLLFLSDLRLKSLEVAISGNPAWRMVRADPYDNDFILEGADPVLVDQAMVNKAGLAATAMFFDDVTGDPGPGLLKVATAKVETFDGLSVTMTFFDQDGVIMTALEAAYDENVLLAPETPAVLPDAPADGALEADTLNGFWNGRLFRIPLQKLAEILKFREEFLRERPPN